MRRLFGPPQLLRSVTVGTWIDFEEVLCLLSYFSVNNACTSNRYPRFRHFCALSRCNMSPAERPAGVREHSRSGNNLFWMRNVQLEAWSKWISRSKRYLVLKICLLPSSKYPKRAELGLFWVMRFLFDAIPFGFFEITAGASGLNCDLAWLDWTDGRFLVRILLYSRN